MTSIGKCLTTPAVTGWSHCCRLYDLRATQAACYESISRSLLMWSVQHYMTNDYLRRHLLDGFAFRLYSIRASAVSCVSVKTSGGSSGQIEPIRPWPPIQPCPPIQSDGLAINFEFDIIRKKCIHCVVKLVPPDVRF